MMATVVRWSVVVWVWWGWRPVVMTVWWWSVATVRHGAEGKATPPLSPWVRALMFVVGFFAVVVGVGIVVVAEERVVTSLVFEVGDEVPEGTRLVVVSN